MNIDPWQLLVVTAAIAIGWFLGRSSKRNSDSEEPASRKLYQGLNYLLNDEADSALDSFVEGLEVNGDTLETHLAIGNLMRRKGEVERAIRVHQNLLSRPSLSIEQLHQAHLELARDYMAAGLLDRAEGLLAQLMREAPELHSLAARLLLEIYQDEREWERAVDLAHQLLPKKSLLKPAPKDDSELSVSLAHYCCEQACLAAEKNDYQQARSLLRQALGHDKRCVRATLMQGEVELASGHARQAIKCLKRIRQQDADFVPETIEPLTRAYLSLGDSDTLQHYLHDCLQDHPSVAVVQAIAENLAELGESEGALDFIAGELRRRPSLRGLQTLLGLYAQRSDMAEAVTADLDMLQNLIDQLLAGKPQYRCRRCGFGGQKLHWLCPGCKTWGTMKPIRGADGD